MVEDGAWKARRVKYHNVDNLDRLGSSCGKHDFDLYLKNMLPRNFIEFLKVFGTPNKIQLPTGKIMYRLVNDGVVISYIEDGKATKFNIADESKTEKKKNLILRQINKSYNCIECGACVGSCPQCAISLNPHFQIDKTKCKNCLICAGTKYLDMSCVAIHYKEDRIIFKRKDL